MQEVEGAHKWPLGQMSRQVIRFLSFAFSAQRLCPGGVGAFGNGTCFTGEGVKPVWSSAHLDFLSVGLHSVERAQSWVPEVHVPSLRQATLRFLPKKDYRVLNPGHYSLLSSLTHTHTQNL